MRKFYCAAVLLMAMLLTKTSYGQDPSFSQFFSSPLNVNPALTGNINADWRVVSNLRDEWIQPASPYATGTLCFDKKIFQDKRAVTCIERTAAIAALNLLIRLPGRCRFHPDDFVLRAAGRTIEQG